MKFKFNWPGIKSTLALVAANSFAVLAIHQGNYWWLIASLMVLLVFSTRG